MSCARELAKYLLVPVPDLSKILPSCRYITAASQETTDYSSIPSSVRVASEELRRLNAREHERAYGQHGAVLRKRYFKRSHVLYSLSIVVLVAWFALSLYWPSSHRSSHVADRPNAKASLVRVPNRHQPHIPNPSFGEVAASIPIAFKPSIETYVFEVSPVRNLLATD